MYRIAIDIRLNRIRVVLGGMMPATEVVAYMRELRHQMVKAGIGPGYGIVIDVSGCTIQTPDMLRTMGEQMAIMPKAGAIAVVSTSALARMQIRRLFHQPYARVVATMADGDGWVTEGIEPSTDLPIPQPVASGPTDRGSHHVA